MVWNPDLPINYLPKEISDIFSIEAEYLLNDLKQRKLEVILVPAPEPKHTGHEIRAVANQNPGWYQELYGAYSFEATYISKKTGRKRRYLRSRVGMQKSLYSLGRIIVKEDKENLFHDALYRELIFDKLYYGEDYSRMLISKDKTIINFFDYGEVIISEESQTEKTTQDNDDKVPF